MSKKKKKKQMKVSKNGPVWKKTAEEVTLSQMPKYNAYAGGYGSHGDRKYNRNKAKRDFQKRLNDEV